MLNFIFFISCHKGDKECKDFNPASCPPNREQSTIVVKFNMDTTKGGFTKKQLENVEATYAKEFYTEKRQSVTSFFMFDSLKNLFYVEYSFYCCTKDNAGIKFFNNNNGKKTTIDKIKFEEKKKEYGYCCPTYFYVQSYNLDGIKYTLKDTVIISNK